MTLKVILDVIVIIALVEFVLWGFMALRHVHLLLKTEEMRYTETEELEEEE